MWPSVEATKCLKRLYRRGYHYCSRCRLGFKADQVPSGRCPYCGSRLRKTSKRGKWKPEKPRIDPHKYVMETACQEVPG